MSSSRSFLVYGFALVVAASGCGRTSDRPEDGHGASGSGAGGSGVAAASPGGHPGQGGEASSAGGASGSGDAGSPGAGGHGAGTGAQSGAGTGPIIEPCEILEKSQYGFSLKDAYMMVPCTEVLDEHVGQPGRACSLGGLQRPCGDVVGGDPDHSGAWVLSELFPFGGCPGYIYELDIRVRGIAEAKYYQGGTRRRGADYSGADSDDGTDTLHIGGEAVPSGHNVYKVAVYDQGMNQLEHYYLNSFPEASGFESPRTFAIAYDLTLQVPAGGYIEYVTKSDDCQAVDNCGPGIAVGECPSPRVVPGEPGLQPPGRHGGYPLAPYNVVTGDQQPFHSQIIHLTLVNTRVVSTGGEGGAGN